MRNVILLLAIIGMTQSPDLCYSQGLDFEKYPHVKLSNKDVKMTVYLPDAEKGVYRATRYDWSGAIGSVQYKDHEYFGFWKDVYNPEVGMLGPADTYKNAGLGYEEAEPGESFIRIGVGLIEKEDEPAYDYHNTYKLVDPGEWIIEKGEDWISFVHIINSDFGYGYKYKKIIRLKEDGFEIEHKLKNTGKKTIETDQYSHNFFMLDNEICGPDIQISYPYPVSTEDDLKDLMEVKGNTLHFTKKMEKGTAFMGLKGFGKSAKDNTFTIKNTKSGAGVKFSVDQPLVKLEFWTNGKTICPENTMQIYVEPGKEQVWTSDYTLFTKATKSGLNIKHYPDGIQRYGHGYSDPNDFTPEEYDYIAKNYSIFTVEKRHAWADYGPKPNTEAATIGTAKKLKAINPDIKVLMYWNIVLNWNYYESQTEFNKHPEWRARDWEFQHVNIDPIPTYDLNNPEVQEWWINAIADPILRGDLDGVFLDAAPKVPEDQYESLYKIIDTLRARIGEDKIVIYNGFRVHDTNLQGGQDLIDHTTGVYIEFFLAKPNDTKEEAALLFDNLIEAQKKGKMIVPCGKPGSVLPGTKQEAIYFNIACYLLFYGPDSYYLYNYGYGKTRGMLEDYPEYNLSPGKPLGSAVRNGWVYTREFENMTVTVDLVKKEAKIEEHAFTSKN
ncbi:putative glycoside hydrolase [Bacteroidota bacterium]